MDLIAEQAVKLCEEFANDKLEIPISVEDKELLRWAVRDCYREDHQVRMILGKFIKTKYGHNICIILIYVYFV
jgi:hypothetical protein